MLLGVCYLKVGVFSHKGLFIAKHTMCLLYARHMEKKKIAHILSSALLCGGWVCDKHRNSYDEKESPRGHVALTVCQHSARHFCTIIMSLNPHYKRTK